MSVRGQCEDWVVIIDISDSQQNCPCTLWNGKIIIIIIIIITIPGGRPLSCALIMMVYSVRDS